VFPSLRVAVIALVVLALGATPAQAKKSDELKEQEREVASQVDSMGETLAAAGSRVTKAMKAFTRVQAKVERAEKAERAAIRKAKIAESKALMAQRAAGKAFAAWKAGKFQEGMVRTELARTELQINEVARAVYQQGPLAEVEVLLDSQSPADFTARLASVDAVGRLQSSVYTGLNRTRADLAMQEVQLQAAKVAAEEKQAIADQRLAESTQARAEAAATTQRLEQVRAEQRVVVRQAQKYKRKVERRLVQLKREQERLAAAAAKAAREEAARAARAGAGAPAMAIPSGGLLWPVAAGGRMSSPVGPRIHPVFGYRSCHTGQDIAAPTGTPVRASADGRVITSGSGGAYGNSIMLVHSGGLTTFYAHLAAKSVQVGQEVKAGDQVGTVGSTGWSTGPHLHYETRMTGTAYDPMGWFGQPSRPVVC
jgi:murein DD-endopeptidase MepM/ murein hydrolase activator NlpD